MIIDFGRIYLYIGADIAWWSIGCPFGDNDSRLLPAITFLGAVRTLNIFQKYLQVRKKIGPEVIFNPLQILFSSLVTRTSHSVYR